jgi:hypothetical protein
MNMNAINQAHIAKVRADLADRLAAAQERAEGTHSPMTYEDWERLEAQVFEECRPMPDDEITCAQYLRLYSLRRRYWAQTAASQRERRIFYKYGLTLEAFDSMLAGQGGVCAACGSAEWGPGGPKVDHDHATGKVRGILCSGCNMAAGHAEDGPERLRALADYLEKSRRTS